MVVSYIVRDVSPDAKCSYPRGRTLLNATGGVYPKLEDAERIARSFNSRCYTTGVVYSAVAHDEHRPFPADHYEQP